MAVTRRVGDLTADVQALQRQVSAERRSDVARRYLALAGNAPTKEQLDCLLTSSTEDPSDATMRAALLSASGAEEQEEPVKEVAEVEHGLL